MPHVPQRLTIPCTSDTPTHLQQLPTFPADATRDGASLRHAARLVQP
jgi:hypothetical protein